LKRRLFHDYKHDEIAKGNQNPIYDLDGNGLDDGLFGLIKADLLGNVMNAFITVTTYSHDYPNTALNNTSSKNFVLQNSGDQTLNVSDFQIIGVENSNFNITNSNIPFDIQPNDSATV